ncbi:MAG TPA: TatD family hydrolase [Candidatus Babeliales bacterium]|nr:TatD family hydrolase [Candidatus Babeliales bacterium]
MQNHKPILCDTHCHINIMVKKTFDTPLLPEHFPLAKTIIDQAAEAGVNRIINVGTSFIESQNCVLLAQHFPNCFAAVGIHPNDATENWRADLEKIEKLIIADNEKNIVAIGECGLDFHYPDFDRARQEDAFRAQIELALKYDRALIVHTRDAAYETLAIIDEFRDRNLRGVIHCFSEDMKFAQEVMKRDFFIGIGGPLTYPKNNALREVFLNVPLERILLETDAPYLPPQEIRGKQNSPAQLKTIAKFLSALRNCPVTTISESINKNCAHLFRLNE